MYDYSSHPLSVTPEMPSYVPPLDEKNGQKPTPRTQEKRPRFGFSTAEEADSWDSRTQKNRPQFGFNTSEEADNWDPRPGEVIWADALKAKEEQAARAAEEQAAKERAVKERAVKEQAVKEQAVKAIENQAC